MKQRFGKSDCLYNRLVIFFKKIRQNSVEIIFEKQSFIGFFVFKINYQNELQEDPLYKGDSFLM